MQERRSKRKSQTADDLPEQSSEREESGLDQSVDDNNNKKDIID